MATATVAQRTATAPRDLSAGNKAAYEDGLAGYLAGHPVALEWITSPEGADAIRTHGLPVNPRSWKGPSPPADVARIIGGAQSPKPYRAGGELAAIPTPLAARKGKTWPMAAVDQTIGEPSTIIGDKTGTKYATLAEDKPEAITITPLRGKAPKRYAAGGTIAATADPNAAAYQQELENAKAALAAEQRVQDAAMNTGNKEQAAMAQTVQNTEDQQYAALGVAKPVDVAVAAGAPGTSGGPLARAAIQTDEQVAQDSATRARSLSYAQSRANSAQAAVNRLSPSSTATDTNAAPPPGSRPRLATDFDGTAGGSRAAGVAASSSAGAKLPVGMVKDADTGEIITAEQARIRAAERGVAYDDVNNRYTTQKDLHARTDDHGNVRRDDGTWVSKQGNELKNGQWTDPSTGNVLIDKDTWLSPDGMKFHITSPAGAGYWESPDGFVLGANGIWTNPLTGQVKINGAIHSPQELSAYRSTKTSSPGYSLDDAAPADTADAGTTDYALP